MFYSLQLDRGPNEHISLRDARTPEQLGAALLSDGYLVVERGEAAYAGFASMDENGQRVESSSFTFTFRNRVVVTAAHVLRIEEIVLRPGTSVTET